MFRVRLLQVCPPSRVRCTRPSLVPAQTAPRRRRDSLIAKTTPAYSTPMLSGVSPPEICCRLLSFRVRSGPNTCQLCPPLVVTWTCWLPTYTRLGSCGEMVSGKFHTNRYRSSAAGHPPVESGHTSTFREIPVRRSWRTTIPPTAPEPEVLDHTMFESAGSGVAQPLSPPPTVPHMPLLIDPGPKIPPNLLLLGPLAEGPSCRLPYTQYGTRSS